MSLPTRNHGSYSNWGEEIPLEEIKKMAQLQVNWEKILSDAIQSVQQLNDENSQLITSSISTPIAPLFTVSISNDLKMSFLVC